MFSSFAALVLEEKLPSVDGGDDVDDDGGGGGGRMVVSIEDFGLCVDVGLSPNPLPAA